MDIESTILKKADPYWLSGPEGSMSAWATLPHGLHGATPAGPVVRQEKPKLPRGKRKASSRPRRRYEQATEVELSNALPHSGRSPVPWLVAGSRAAARRKRSRTKRAHLIENDVLDQVAAYVKETSRSLASDNVKLMLSFKAGLRAGEIAQIALSAFCFPGKEIRKDFEVVASISKSRKTRSIPVHPELKRALDELRRCHPEATHVAFSVGRGGRIRRQNPAAVTTWFHHLYRRVGLAGCSSHSGRRTFATKMARIAGGCGGSLRDIQKLMGHARLSSTECYLEASANVRSLVDAI